MLPPVITNETCWLPLSFNEFVPEFREGFECIVIFPIRAIARLISHLDNEAWLILSDYLKTGMRAACPAEQEVQDGEGKEAARAAAADLASAG